MGFPFPELEEQPWETREKRESGFCRAKIEAGQNSLNCWLNKTIHWGPLGWGDTQEVVSGKDPGHSRVAKSLDMSCVNGETGAQEAVVCLRSQASQGQLKSPISQAQQPSTNL